MQVASGIKQERGEEGSGSERNGEKMITTGLFGWETAAL